MDVKSLEEKRYHIRGGLTVVLKKLVQSTFNDRETRINGEESRRKIRRL